MRAEAAATVTARERTAALRLALRSKYAAPEWLLFEEISLDGMGRVDGVAINCWSSSGFEIHGFELKASRSDWLREMKRMEKSARAFDFCHRWWLVTAPGVALPDEIPTGWGWYQLNAKDQLRKMRPAPATEAKPLGMRQIVNLLSRAHRRNETDEERRLLLLSEYQRGYDAGKAAGQRHGFDEDKLAALSAFEARTGIPLYSSNVERIAQAVLYVMQRPDDHVRRMVQGARLRAEQFLEQTEWAR